MYYLQGGITRSKKFNTVLGAKRHLWTFANFVRLQVIRLKDEDGNLIATHDYNDNKGWR
jgi:hypothetical protein